MSGTRNDRPLGGSRESGDEALRLLVQLTRETLSEEATRDAWPVDENGLRRLDHSARRGVRLRWPVVSVLALAALAMVAAPAAWFAARRPGPLTFEVIDGTVGAAGEIQHGRAGTRIHFSDGSDITLGLEAHAQVGDLAAEGGRIVLSNGRAHTFFVPRPHTRWQVVAGPYVVQVTGTIFDVQWSDENQAFDVWLQKGSVRVSGPLIGDGIVVTHGHHLLTRVKDNKVLLDSQAEPAEPVAAPELAAVEPAPVPEAAAAAAPGGSAQPAEPSQASDDRAGDLDASRGGPDRARPLGARSWGRRLARGDFEAVVAAAEHRGIDSVLSHGSLSQLSALADAARYTRRSRLAGRALVAERERFPETSEGREAAFFLGNLAEDDRDAHGAASWYARYLHEDSSGTYAAQSLGRKMLIESDRGGPAARTDAAEYLHRFPTGSYADAARLILKQ
jgi:FecR protein